jgi:hypothetical protein
MGIRRASLFENHKLHLQFLLVHIIAVHVNMLNKRVVKQCVSTRMKEQQLILFNSLFVRLRKSNKI